MSEDFSQQIADELKRIEQLAPEEQVAAYRALHELLEQTLNESN
jgi:hypothetical protein